MSLFDEPEGKDLFDKILQNPDLPMSISQTIQTFIEKLQNSDLLKCSICYRPIANKIFLYANTKMLCVVCFAGNSTDFQSYLTINLAKRIFRHSKWTAHEELQVLQLMQSYGVDNYQEIARNMPTQMSTDNIQKYQSRVFEFLPNREAEVKGKESVEPWRKLSNKFTDYFAEDYTVLDYMIGHLHQQSDPEMSAFLLAKKRQQDLQKERILKWIEGIARCYPHGSSLDKDEEEKEKDMKIFQEKMKKVDELAKVTQQLLQECDEVIKQRQLYDHKRGRPRKHPAALVQPTKIKRLRKAKERPKPTSKR